MVQRLGVVVAAGSGTRLGSALPKALVEVGERPLVWHAANALGLVGCSQVVVTAPPERIADFEVVLADLAFVNVVAGGGRRQDSVRIALEQLQGEDDDLVLVHDAARPLTPVEVPERVVQALLDGHEAVIPVVPVVDTIRQLSPQGSAVVDREQLRAVQTPQGFRLGGLRQAHAAAKDLAMTDDAAAMELLGAKVELVAGDYRAMKITEPADLMVARELAKGS